ncbi:hypothetical protein L1987_47057 [Smallanthus sonchifolius]|uniref:Uncharacterized protein n=1 Tax=Smallanthus sonchifolius TaxID=185202 RepID=A0ACB9G1I3_9ASTR|nr:hypothetical protein L1987_47057 [Smallanthus sonchifolius]
METWALMKKFSVVVLCALMMVLLAADVQKTNALALPPIVCDPQALSSCTPAIFFGFPPSTDCCNSLRALQPCFCEFIRNPTFGQFISSPNAQKLAKACNVTIPTNCTRN